MTCSKGASRDGVHYVTSKMLLNALQKLPEEELNPVFEVKRPGKSMQREILESCRRKRERIGSADSEDILIFSQKSRSQKRLKLLESSVVEPGEAAQLAVISGRVLLDKDVNIPSDSKGIKQQSGSVSEEAAGPAATLETGKPRMNSFSSCSDKQVLNAETLPVSRIDLCSDAKKIKVGQPARCPPRLGYDVKQCGFV